eukprot:NODE_4951_length_1827_cov_5.058824.p10 GENE.NODE_4951_length_1827_cov_5.058824~~NODE_4951_length_1827_cov_5.058824.p10  ORF type:complete len:89 (+),score=1.67 NODE_4951_length_1827_cov_5.058824:104-370(+)
MVLRTPTVARQTLFYGDFVGVAKTNHHDGKHAADYCEYGLVDGAAWHFASSSSSFYCCCESELRIVFNATDFKYRLVLRPSGIGRLSA